MVRVTVPATSANMGSGYDSIGIALELYNVIDLAENDHIDISDKNGQYVPQDESNLIYQCAKRVYDECGKPLSGLTIVEDCAIPQTRGLGSSSACTVAGIMGAAALTGRIVGRAEAVSIATEMEGHPDNVAPAIMGSLVCSFTPQGELPNCIRYNVNPNLRFVTVIPPYEVKTEEARKIVPQEVPLSTAVWQMGRISGLTRGLESGDVRLIAAACDDKIQEPFRRELIPDYDEVRDVCLNGGAATLWISGSGSTLMAVTDDGLVAESLRARLQSMHPDFQVHVLECDTQGVRIQLA